MIATGYKALVDDEICNQFHQKWLQQQDVDGT